ALAHVLAPVALLLLLGLVPVVLVVVLEAHLVDLRAVVAVDEHHVGGAALRGAGERGDCAGVGRGLGGGIGELRSSVERFGGCIRGRRGGGRCRNGVGCRRRLAAGGDE